MLVGVTGVYQGVMSSLKQWRRFKESRPNDSWYIGRERWDAIIFVPKKDVKIYGIGVYEKYE